MGANSDIEVFHTSRLDEWSNYHKRTPSPWFKGHGYYFRVKWLTGPGTTFGPYPTEAAAVEAASAALRGE